MRFRLKLLTNKIFYIVIFFSIITILTSLILSGGCSAKDLDKFQLTREMMGTFISVSVYADDEEFAQSAINSAFVEMERIEYIASIYSEDSEATFLNNNGYIDNPSAELYEMITEAKNYTEFTEGAFDITVQPILELWQSGLWEEEESEQGKRVNETLALVGSDMISVDVNRIEFERKGMKITLGGIAKGYAVDKAIKVLEDKGIKHALVNAGGDIRAIGKKPDGSFWTVALQNPDNKDEEIEVFKISDIAITTSGNYERYFNPDKDVHHITDPRTGYSANKCISATVISNSGMDADALSTSIFVLGPEKGLELVNKLDGVETLIIDNNRNIFRSKGLEKYIN